MGALQREHRVGCRLMRAIIEYGQGISAPVRLADFTAAVNGQPVLTVSLALRPHLCDDERAGPNPVARVGVGHDTGLLALSIPPSALQALKDAVNDDADGGSHSVRRKRAEASAGLVRSAFAKAAQQLCGSGPMHMKLVGVQVVVESALLLGDPSSGAVDDAALAALTEALKHTKAVATAMEPLMDLHVGLTDASYAHAVSQDLHRARESASVEMLENDTVIEAVVPMRTIVRYSADVRKLTKGNVHFWTALRCYRAIEDSGLAQRIFDARRS